MAKKVDRPRTYSALPDFDHLGGLPEGVYWTTEELFRERFVTGWNCEPRRAEIFEGFLRLRTEAEQNGISGLQWVDGGFITEKHHPPDDIDVVTFICADHFNSLTLDQQSYIEQKLNAHHRTKAAFLTHTFREIVVPPSHPLFAIYEGQRAYWRGWWGKHQDLGKSLEMQRMGIGHTTGNPKGFVQMYLGNPALAPKVSQRR